MSEHLSAMGLFLREVPGKRYCVPCCCSAVWVHRPEKIREAEREVNLALTEKEPIDFQVSDKGACCKCERAVRVVWFEG